MAVQATGAMAIVVADVGAVRRADDPERALSTLSILTGVVMLAAGPSSSESCCAGLQRGDRRFTTAVGVDIVLGRLDNFSGFESTAGNRIARAVDLLLNLRRALAVDDRRCRDHRADHPSRAHATRCARHGGGDPGCLGLRRRCRVGWRPADAAHHRRAQDSLPLPVLPDLSGSLDLVVPAVALTFVGLVQGGISVNFPNSDGTYADASQVFVGQGGANVAAGLLQEMPVGGSMSARALVKGRARDRERPCSSRVW